MPAKKKPTAKKATPKKRAPKVDPKVAERRDRFARIFPPRVEKLVKSLEVLTNCSSKSSYDWTPDLVQRAWIEIAKTLSTAAKSFDLDLEIRLNGKDIREIDTSKALRKMSHDHVKVVTKK